MKYCADCCYMNTCDDRDGRFKCENSRKSGYDKVSARMIACGSFLNAGYGARGEAAREYLMSISRNHGYYLTTLICDVLGLEQSKRYKDNFKYLKNQILPLIKGGDEWVKDYDTYGQEIADKIRNRSDAKEICKGLYDDYLATFNKLFEDSDVDSAFVVYDAMYQELKEKYCDLGKSR